MLRWGCIREADAGVAKFPGRDGDELLLRAPTSTFLLGIRPMFNFTKFPIQRPVRPGRRIYLFLSVVPGEAAPGTTCASGMCVCSWERGPGFVRPRSPPLPSLCLSRPVHSVCAGVAAITPASMPWLGRGGRARPKTPIRGRRKLDRSHKCSIRYSYLSASGGSWGAGLMNGKVGEGQQVGGCRCWR